MKNVLSPRKQSQKGSALVEFAIGSSILMAVFAGTYQFGYSFYVYNNLQTAVNNGAKYASLRTYEQATGTPSSCFSDAVENMVVYGNPSGGTIPVAPNLGTDNVFIVTTFSNGVPSTMTVGISNYTIDAVFKRFPLTNKPQVTYPFLGRYAPGNPCTP
jgi:Flp pilus assembly protein TadG